MSKLSPEIKEFLLFQKLGFVATVCPDNTPNVSPKGTIIPWKDETLIFADIRSPQTMTNLQTNPHIEINVVDPISRKGYRFKGTSIILKDGAEYSEMLQHYKEIGVQSEINAIVKVTIDTIQEVTSPLYDIGFSEEEIREKWKKHFSL